MAQRISLSLIARSTTLAVAFSILALIAIGGPIPVHRDAAMTCFTIASDVTCIESGGAQAPLAPPIMAPMGPIFGGDDEEIVMRDNGGRVVERG